MAVITLDIGGTTIKYGIVSSGTIHKHGAIPTDAHRGRAATIARIDEAVRTLLHPGIKKICISMAGPADYARGVFIHPPNLPLHGFNIKNYLKKKYGLPVSCENDARCYALGELHYGAGKNARNLVAVTLGTGTGFGIIINKKIYCGRGNAGEISGSYIYADRTLATVEENLGTRWILHALSHCPTPRDTYLRARSGNARAKRIWETYGANLGIALINVMTALDPDTIIIGGNVANAWSAFVPAMRARIRKDMKKFAPCPVVRSRLKHAALLGASLLDR